MVAAASGGCYEPRAASETVEMGDMPSWWEESMFIGPL
jgi:hypothetical protein